MMTTVDRSARAVETLSRVDPEFAELVQVLYGDAVDPEDVWRDTFGKAAPDQSDVSTKDNDSLKRRAAFASTLAGGVLGIKELGKELPQLGRAVKTGSGVLVPARRTAVAGVALGGDALAGSELKPRNKQQDVNKALPGIADMASGIRSKLTGVTRKLIPMGGGSKPVQRVASIANLQSNAVPPVMGQWAQLGRGVGMAAGSTPGKIAIGTGAAVGGAKAYRNRQSDSMSKRNEIVWEGTFSKFDEDKHLAFGWASVIKVNGVPVVDQQSDQIDEADLEDAAYRYVQQSRKGGDMHRRDEYDQPVHVSDIVESVVFTDEKVAKMGLPDDFPRGWWIGVKVHDPETWSEVKKGNRTGFSIHGRGKRQDIDIDTAMGYS